MTATKRTSRGTTTRGYVNRNRQTVIAATGLPGNDHLQKVYILERGNCGRRYGANGNDIFLRLCPFCMGGSTGLPYE